MRPELQHKSLLAVHVAASAGVLGADLGLLTLGGASLAGADPVTIYPAAHLIAARLLMPMALLALGSGVLLGLLTPWGLFKYWWVMIKLAIVIILSGVLVFVLVPALEATAGAVSDPMRGALTTAQRIPLAVAPAAASALLTVALVLAIFKPGWRVKRGVRAGDTPPA